MKIRKLFILISFLLTLAIGCKEDLVLDSNLTIVNTKIYDDTLVKPDYSVFKIAEDGNRMFMCYGNKNVNFYSNGAFSFINSKTTIISTDYTGNLIWKASIPDKIEMGNIVALENGSCLVSGSLGSRIVPEFNFGPIYLFQFDKNGTQIAVNAAVLPASISTDYKILNHSMQRLANGNLLFYGSYLDYTVSNGLRAFAAEFTISSTFVWAKSYIIPSDVIANFTNIYDGVITEDGDFYFIGEYAENENSQALFLLRTNEVGGILVVKKFPNLNHQNISLLSSCRIIEQTSKKYTLSFYRKITNKSVLCLYNINSIGDSLSYSEIDILNNNFSTVLLPLENEKIFCLVNSFELDYGNINEYQVFKQANTNYLILNSNFGIDVNSPFQTRTTDFINAACKRADGSIANFGVVQPRGKNYYKPQLIIIK